LVIAELLVILAVDRSAGSGKFTVTVTKDDAEQPEGLVPVTV
jgi:hypothetical protein